MKLTLTFAHNPASDDTAKLLMAVGKERWLSERKDPVHAKGKGVLRTFWLRIGDGSIASGSYARSSQASSTDENPSLLNSSFEESDRIPEKPRRTKKRAIVPTQKKSSKADRLVQWNADLLARHLKEIQAQRRIRAKQLDTVKPRKAVHETFCGDTDILDEVKDVLELLAHSSSVQTIDAESLELPPEVQKQLVDYVHTIADLYHEHPFHNWGTFVSFCCIPYLLCYHRITNCAYSFP